MEFFFKLFLCDASHCAHCFVRRETVCHRGTEGAKTEAEMQQSVSLYLNPFDILYVQTESVGQTLVICLKH